MDASVLRILPRPVKRAITRLFEEKIDREMQARLEKEVPARTGLTSVGSYDMKDIFVVGYPKSGNTWFQNLIASLVYGVTTEFTPDTLIQELVPDLHHKRYYRRFHTPMFFKSHDLPTPACRRVVYLIRDGRDAIISYFYYLRTIERVEIDPLEAARSGKGLVPCRWHEHVEAWLANPHGAEILTIRYEDLKTDTARELRRFCEFVGLDRSDANISSVAANVSLENMRKQESAFGWARPHWPRNQTFLRRGKVGSYRDEMSPAILEAFTASARPTLEKLGYAVGPASSTL
jgi:hypothetical protein